MAEPTSARVTASAVTVQNVRLRKRLYDLGWTLYGAGTIAIGGFMALSQFLGYGAHAHAPPWISIPVTLFALGAYAWPVMLLAGLFAGRKRSLGTATIDRDAGVLRVRGEKGELTVPAGPGAQGTVVDGRLVLDGTDGREVTIETPDAGRLLDELDLEPAARRFTFRWRRVSPRVWSFIGTLFGTSALAMAPMILLSGAGSPPLAALGCMLMSSPWLVAELVSRWYANRELTVGLDGLATKSRRGKNNIRFADVASVETTPSELVLVMKDGRRERVLADPEQPEMRAAITQRIAEARAIAARNAGAGSAAGALLDRVGRSLPEWRAAAARVLTASTGFRDAAVTPEEISAVIDDATAPAEQRIAAAIALGSREDPVARARIRVAADACASPKLRVALEGLADGDASDDLLEAALEETKNERSR